MREAVAEAVKAGVNCVAHDGRVEVGGQVLQYQRERCVRAADAKQGGSVVIEVSGPRAHLVSGGTLLDNPEPRGAHANR